MPNKIIGLTILIVLSLLFSCKNSNSSLDEMPQAYKNAAVLPYTQLILKEKDNPEHYYNRAQALNNIYADSLARLDFEKAISLNTENISYKNTYGYFLLEINDFLSAEQIFQQVLTQRPKNDDATTGLLQAYLGQNEVKKAASLLNPILESVPDHAKFLYFKAELLLLEKDTALALKLLDNILLINKDLYDPEMLKANIYAAQNNIKAVETYEKVFSKDTMDVYPLEKAGDFYMLHKDYTNAIHFYKKSVNHDMMYAFGFYKLGEVYYIIDSLDKAMKNYELAILNSPAYAEAFLGKAKVYSKMNDIDSAVRYADLALRFDKKLQEAISILKKYNAK